MGSTYRFLGANDIDITVVDDRKGVAVHEELVRIILRRRGGAATLNRGIIE